MLKQITMTERCSNVMVTLRRVSISEEGGVDGGGRGYRGINGDGNIF